MLLIWGCDGVLEGSGWGVVELAILLSFRYSFSYLIMRRIWWVGGNGEIVRTGVQGLEMRVMMMNGVAVTWVGSMWNGEKSMGVLFWDPTSSPARLNRK